jgi:chemotaxis protein MotB
VLEGLSVATVPGSMGPGGAGDAPVQVFDAVKPPDGDPGDGETEDPAEGGAAPMTDEEIEAQAKEIEKARLEDLKEQLEEAIDQSASLAAFKEQLLLDITPEGLRIQIVDQQNRPMFDSGSFRLQSYTINILNELAPYLQGVPNRLSITGHTDTTPFGGGDSGYTNWELSADRANAARRALVSGGVSMEKMARVVGVSDSVLFDKENPTNPINRRISIIVMNKATEDAALGRNEVPVDDAASGEAPAEGTTEAATEAAGDAAAVPEAAPAEAPAEASTETPPAG